MERKKIVTIGGGNGSFTLLNGLKKYSVDLTAIVSMTDNGGASGVLRDELGVLPPGDVRQCLVALSDSSEMLRKLMNYRFEEGGLKGHSFGNLLLSALEKINGSFAKGVEEAVNILNVKGEVVPVLDKDTNILFELKNGKKLNGVVEVDHSFDLATIGVKSASLFPRTKASKKAIEKILEADLIVIGPGHHYCSIIPNLLAEGIPQAIRASKAVVVYNCNLVNKKGHNDGFSLDDYVTDINKYLGGSRINFATFNSQKPAAYLIKKYADQKELLVSFDKNQKTDRNYKIVKADLISGKKPSYSKVDVFASRRAFIRHDSDKLAKVLMMILEMGDFESIIKEII
jgi:uncharacterized cofD-like protein